ncbi:MAG TPA: hypothetical protein VIM33_14985, partial [Gaiellaceae bacterium]
AGDYLWIDSVGSFSYGVWTDWRNTRSGTDPRETAAPDEDDRGTATFPTASDTAGPLLSTADVWQCRTFSATTGTWSADSCPFAGGLDQNIYGDYTP